MKWLRGLTQAPKDSPRRTLFVAFSVCLVCSVVVATAAVSLRPMQIANALLERKKNILEVAGLSSAKDDVDELFAQLEPRIVDLQTGRFSDAFDALAYDQRRASSDPELSVAVAPERDIASIGRRARYATVYLARREGRIERVILPVRGYGLWSTMYGLVALTGDFNTIDGLVFYEHGETPGLGAEIDNPAWQAKWRGKRIYDEQGDVRIEVVKRIADPRSPDADYQVDGIAGATLTSRGVGNLLRYWLGEDGFGPFISQLQQTGE